MVIFWRIVPLKRHITWHTLASINTCIIKANMGPKRKEKFVQLIILIIIMHCICIVLFKVLKIKWKKRLNNKTPSDFQGSFRLNLWRRYSCGTLLSQMGHFAVFLSAGEKSHNATLPLWRRRVRLMSCNKYVRAVLAKPFHKSKYKLDYNVVVVFLKDIDPCAWLTLLKIAT